MTTRPVLGTEEVQKLHPNETQADIARYLAAARQRGLSRENTLWLLSYARGTLNAIARLETAELPHERLH